LSPRLHGGRGDNAHAFRNPYTERRVRVRPCSSIDVIWRVSVLPPSMPNQRRWPFVTRVASVSV
jgi:hypothetical protein